MSDRGVESRVSAERIEAAATAAQQWWDEFCTDTGDHPGFIWSEMHNGHRLTYAGFMLTAADAFWNAALVAAGVADLESASRALLDSHWSHYCSDGVGMCVAVSWAKFCDLWQALNPGVDLETALEELAES